MIYKGKDVEVVSLLDDAVSGNKRVRLYWVKKCNINDHLDDTHILLQDSKDICSYNGNAILSKLNKTHNRVDY